jgi:hypothetical protein
LVFHVRETVDRLYENGWLQRVFGSREEKVAVAWKKLHNWLRNLYSESNIIMVIILKGMG